MRNPDKLVYAAIDTRLTKLEEELKKALAKGETILYIRGALDELSRLKLDLIGMFARNGLTN